MANTESASAFELPVDSIREKAVDLFEDAIGRLKDNRDFQIAAAAKILSPDSTSPRELEFETKGEKYSLFISHNDHHKFLKLKYRDAEIEEDVSLLVNYEEVPGGEGAEINEASIVYRRKYMDDGSEQLGVNSLDAVINAIKFVRRI